MAYPKLYTSVSDCKVNIYAPLSHSSMKDLFHLYAIFILKSFPLECGNYNFLNYFVKSKIEF